MYPCLPRDGARCCHSPPARHRQPVAESLPSRALEHARNLDQSTFPFFPDHGSRVVVGQRLGSALDAEQHPTHHREIAEFHQHVASRGGSRWRSGGQGCPTDHRCRSPRPQPAWTSQGHTAAAAAPMVMALVHRNWARATIDDRASRRPPKRLRPTANAGAGTAGRSETGADRRPPPGSGAAGRPDRSLRRAARWPPSCTTSLQIRRRSSLRSSSRTA